MIRKALAVPTISAVVFTLSCAGGSPDVPTAPSAPPAATGTPAPQPTGPVAPPTWDVERDGVPRFITHNYIDLNSIRQISRFRSGVGHSATDAFESCRSMKHYFMPPTGSAARSVPIFSPVSGVVFRAFTEWAGLQIHITSDDYPAFRVILFHVNATVGVAEGTHYDAGVQIGTHIGDQTMSDVAVSVDDPSGYRLVSWFEAITDSVFDTYRARGLQARSDAIITRAERDASPLHCSGENFLGQGALPNWIKLR